MIEHEIIEAKLRIVSVTRMCDDSIRLVCIL